MTWAGDGIGLPIAEPATMRHNSGALIDVAGVTQPTGILLGAPVSVQQCGDDRPVGLGEAKASLGALLG